MSRLVPGARARTSAEKQERRSALVDAARVALLEGGTVEGVSLADVAAGAGLSKASSYAYFASKESLFLALLLDELDGWLAELGPALAAARRERIARIIAGSLEVRPVLVRLLASLHGTLEANVPEDELLAFKRALLARLEPAAAALGQATGRDDGLSLLLRVHVLVVGLAHVASPPAAVAAVIASHPELAALDVPFAATLEAGLGDWLR